MSEVAHILKKCHPKKPGDPWMKSGRGTSTFDGMSIAKAVVEYIVKEKSLHCKTLFATHYHELTELENQYEGVVNLQYCGEEAGATTLFSCGRSCAAVQMIATASR